MPARLSPAHEAEIREELALGDDLWKLTLDPGDLDALLVELDAVRRERDEAVKAAATMRDALERISDNARAHHGPPHSEPGSSMQDCGPARALRVVGTWAAATLAAVPSSTDGPGVRLTAAEAEMVAALIDHRIGCRAFGGAKGDCTCVRLTALRLLAGPSWPDNPGVVAAAAVFRSRESEEDKADE